MSEYILKLQKNIFSITIGTSMLLGIAVAYLLSVILRFLLSGPGPGAMNLPQVRAAQAGTEQAFRAVDEFLGIPTGNFIRDSGTSAAAGGGAAGVAGAGEIELVGVLYATPLQFARALIKEAGQERPDSYGLGKTVAGFKLVGIHPKSITVDVNGNQLTIPVGGKSSEGVSGGGGGGAQTASKPGEAVVTVSKDRLKDLTKNPEVIYKNKFSPVVINGKIAGMKLIFVPEDGLLFDLGARSGDIIRRVNGEPLENESKMFQMWQNLYNQSKITIDLERGGKIQTTNIVIQ